MRKTTAGIAGIIALAAPAALAIPADAARPSESWVMNSQTIDGVDRPIRIAATGPVQGAGVLTQEFEEIDSGGVAHAVWHLSKGTVTADAVEDYAFEFDPVACRGTARSSGTWQITGGTGAYADATGHGTFTGRGTIIGQRDEHGQCQGPESGVNPRAAIATLHGEGVAEIG